MHRPQYFRILLGFASICSLAVAVPAETRADEPAWFAGLSRVEVTPREPVRMAGYGSRDHASEGIDTPLHARCLALREKNGHQVALMISVDTIGLPGSMTRQLASSIQEKHGVDREQVVFCSTHTHCGPDLVSELSNIFASPLTENEIAAGERYKAQLADGILRAVDLAIDDLKPAALGIRGRTDWFCGESSCLDRRSVDWIRRPAGWTS